jgi:uncharacterized protein DUF2628
MLREFEIFSKASLPSIAVKRGFSWPGFFFSWIWAFTKGLWVQGIILLAIGLAIGFFKRSILAADPLLILLPALVLDVIVGIRGNAWRSRKLERAGYDFAGLVEARSPASAVAAHALGKKHAPGSSSKFGSLISVPRFAQGLVAVTVLTWKAALRFRLFLAISVLLLLAVVGLPILVKDDGTARGFTQILLTYTLSAITALLGISTLWLSCGTLARDIEECQIQVVATKPIARWQIWLGKWLGIVSLNAVLLVLSGICVYGLLQWRSTKLPAEEQKKLHDEVLVARSSAMPEDIQAKVDEETRKILEDRLKQTKITEADLPEVKRQITERVKAEYQLVPPGYSKTWRIHIGAAAKNLEGQSMQLRIKFNAAQKSSSGTFVALWRAGVPPKTKNFWSSEPMSLAPDTFHEITIPPGLIDPDGVLTVSFGNPNDTAILFPLEDGMEALYRDGGFGMNFARGLGIVFCWMALLAAIGLASASFLSFPVAAFLSLGILIMALSSGTLANVVSEGSIDSSAQADKTTVTILDTVIVPVFRVALRIINLAREFSPIDSLSTGRTITWGQLGFAFSQIVLLLGGIFAFFGIFVFNRRELATAQNQ